MCEFRDSCWLKTVAQPSALFLQCPWLLKVLFADFFDRFKYFSFLKKYTSVLSKFSNKELSFVFLLSILRYFVFSLQFLILLNVFDVKETIIYSFIRVVIGPIVGLAFVKSGFNTCRNFKPCDVETKESLHTDSAYPNATMDGTTYGLGWKGSFDNGVFIKTETMMQDWTDLHLEAEGATVIEYVLGVPTQPFNDGVTVMKAVTGTLFKLIAVNDGILPVPLEGNPIDEFVFVQAYVTPVKLLENTVAGTISLLE